MSVFGGFDRYFVVLGVYWRWYLLIILSKIIVKTIAPDWYNSNGFDLLLKPFLLGGAIYWYGKIKLIRGFLTENQSGLTATGVGNSFIFNICWIWFLTAMLARRLANYVSEPLANAFIVFDIFFDYPFLVVSIILSFLIAGRNLDKS